MSSPSMSSASSSFTPPLALSSTSPSASPQTPTQPTGAPTRVLLADDQEKVRSALRLMIEQEQEQEQELAFDVVGEAGAADELLRRILESGPQIVLLDWELPGLPEAHKLEAMRSLAPHLKVIVLSGQPEAKRKALDEGADVFVSKSDPPEGVLKALYFVCGKV